MAQRPDDDSISDDALLWRGILPQWIHQLADGSTQPQSLAFVDGSESGEVSFFLAAETSKERVMAGRPFTHIAVVRATVLRELGYTLARDPGGASGDTAHVVACPDERKTRKQIQRDARKIRDAAEWVE